MLCFWMQGAANPWRRGGTCEYSTDPVKDGRHLPATVQRVLRLKKADNLGPRPDQGMTGVNF